MSIIELETVRQLRDPIALAGGPSGRLFRSAKLYGATDIDRTALSHMLAGGRIIDLRTPGRATAEPDPDIDGVVHAAMPLPPTLYVGYPHIVRQNRSELRTIMGLLSLPGPVLVHCTEGKDRTGIVIALAMIAAGYSAFQVVREFTTTPCAPVASLYEMFVVMREDCGTTDLRYWFNHNNGLGMSYDEYARLGSRFSA